MPGLPGGTAELIRRCLAKDPADRPSARQLATAWARAAGQADRSRTALRSLVTLAGLAYRPRAAIAGGLAVAGLSVIALLTSAAQKPGVPVWAGFSAAPACQITYQLHSDDGKAFTGDLTVRNTGDRSTPAATVAFTVHGGQQLTGTGAAWTQNGTSVRVRAASLAPGAQQVLPFHGTYLGNNPMPGAFALGGLTCEPLTIGLTAPPDPPAPAVRPAAPEDKHGKHKGHD
jgi:serine/threonine-protein kinase